jgi:hypothetical protein
LWLGVAVVVLVVGFNLAKLFFLVSVPKIRSAADQAEARQKFKQITLGMAMYAQEHNGEFVEQAWAVPPSKFKHSWRVHILPYIEQGPLYDQIHLDEPWDSEANSRFHYKTPSAFRPPEQTKLFEMTFIQVVYGPGTAFPGSGQKMRYPASFVDGTSQTVILVEAARAVNWMQPEDIDIQQVRGSLLDKLGTRPGATGPLVGTADGTAHFLKPGITEKTLRAALTPAGNEVLGPDW